MSQKALILRSPVVRHSMPPKSPTRRPSIQKACRPSALPGVLAWTIISMAYHRPRSGTAGAGGAKLLPQYLPSPDFFILCQ